MIRYYIYDSDTETYREVSKDIFYISFRLLKTKKLDFTVETINRFIEGELVKYKRLFQNADYL